MEIGGWRQSLGRGNRGGEMEGDRWRLTERKGGERRLLSNETFFFFFFKKKKPIHLRGEWRHQIGVLGEFKRGVDVAHEDWFGVREGTHLLGEHPLHPKKKLYRSVVHHFHYRMKSILCSPPFPPSHNSKSTQL
ncbi:hypothetical protein Hanom_Chr16g01498171 [Helianthus anomalus]